MYASRTESMTTAQNSILKSVKLQSFVDKCYRITSCEVKITFHRETASIYNIICWTQNVPHLINFNPNCSLLKKAAVIQYSRG